MKLIWLAFITAVLFSGSFVAAKYTTYDLNPLTASFLRYLIALIFLIVLAKIKKLKLIRIERKDLIKLMALGLFGIVGYHYFFFTSLRYTDVSNTGIINATSPVITAIMASIFLRENLTSKNYFGLLISFIGVLVLLSSGDLNLILNMDIRYGDLLMLVAVVNWVVYSLIIKSLSRKYDSLTLTFFATLFGVVFLLFLSYFEGGFTQIVNISKISLISIVYMGVFASGLGYLLYNISIVKVGPTKTASIVYSCVPIFVAILSLVFFNEVFTISLIISIVCIIFGLNLILRKKQ